MLAMVLVDVAEGSLDCFGRIVVVVVVVVDGRESPWVVIPPPVEIAGSCPCCGHPLFLPVVVFVCRVDGSRE